MPHPEIIAISQGDAAPAATIDSLRAALVAARADNAELIRLACLAVESVRGLLYSDGTDAAIKRADRWMPGFTRQLAADHPGDALLDEMAAARAIVEEARMRNPVEPCLCNDCSSWRALYAAYDAAVKARSDHGSH